MATWPSIRVERVEIDKGACDVCGGLLDANDRALHVEDIDTLIFICKKCLFRFTQEAGG
jgi:hypothetical protein